MKNSILNHDKFKFFNESPYQTADKITLLSRQLRTYLNNRESTILAICRDNSITFEIKNINSIQKWETELNQVYFDYNIFLKKFIGSKEEIKMRVLVLAKKAYSKPNSIEAREFNQFLKNKIKLWDLLHILSELEIHTRPQLLKRVLTISIGLCNEESKLNVIIPDFFKQLKLNYQQLERECEQLFMKEFNEKKKKIIKKSVLIRE